MNDEPELGMPVIYTSKNGDGIMSPAIVLRTRKTTNLEVLKKWPKEPNWSRKEYATGISEAVLRTEPAPNTLSGKYKPEELVDELPDDYTVDLLVHGLGGDHRQFCVPFSFKGDPHTWSWSV